ncbi:MAG: glycoside hydrolase family 16 protein [Burkholderiales bacterium]
MKPARRRWLTRVLTGTAWLATGARATTRPGDVAEIAPVPPAIRDQGYRLVQDWDFATTVNNVTRLRETFFTRFVYEDGKLDRLNDEWQRYRDNDNHVFEDGVLALVARAPGPIAAGKIESGMLRSKWSGRLGYFECRMKLPGARGLWPAFWLNPQDAKWPPEIDIVEVVNNGRDTTRNSFHYLHPGKEVRAVVATSRLDVHGSYRPGFDYRDDFHTFAVEWTDERVRHFVDDVLVVDREFRWAHKDGTDAGPAHVLLNLAVGGNWPGAPAADAFPAKLLVKHIRVWQR